MYLCIYVCKTLAGRFTVASQSCGVCSIKGFRVLNLWFRGSRFLGLVNPAPSQGVGAEALMTACARELRCLSRSLCTRNT